MRWTSTPRGHADDRGMTLVELLVVVVISGLVLPLVVGILIAAQQQASGAVRTADSTGDLRLAVATIDRQVRLASGSLSWDSSTPLTVPASAIGLWAPSAADGTPTPRCVQFKVVGGTLRTRSFAPASPTPPAWSTAAVIGPPLSSATPFQGVAADAAGTVLIPGTVRVRLAATPAGGRSVSLDSSLTIRNTTTAASACGTFT